MFIKVENVSYIYPKSTKKVLNNINLDLYRKDFTAIIGSNGSGKTTLCKLLTGIFKPEKGCVLIDGIDSRKMNLCQCGKKIGYLFQNPDRQIFAPTVEEELAFTLDIKGMGKENIEIEINKMMEIFDLNHLRNRFPFSLSRGEKQRLALAAIFINEPKFLILDEPTTGLDIERIKVLSKMINKLKLRGIGITVISHNEEFVKQHATRIVRMESGQIVEDIRP